MGIPRTTDDWPISSRHTDWVAPTQSSGATLLANGFKSGSAAIPHWPMAVRGETSIMYINITRSQSSHHSLMMEMVSETLDFHPQLTQLVAQDDFIEFSHRESFKSYVTLGDGINKKVPNYIKKMLTYFNLLGPNISLDPLFLNTCNPCFSPTVRDHISHQYKRQNYCVYLNKHNIN
jgi:hypothetical protein